MQQNATSHRRRVAFCCIFLFFMGKVQVLLLYTTTTIKPVPYPIYPLPTVPC